MIEAAELSISYVDGYEKSDFFADRRTQQAVTMNLVVIGETSARILADHPEHVMSTPEIDWRAIRNMRNRIAHSYHSVDYDVVWFTTKVVLPELLKILKSGA